jgi:hypothetical protein
MIDRWLLLILKTTLTGSVRNKMSGRGNMTKHAGQKNLKCFIIIWFHFTHQTLSVLGAECDVTDGSVANDAACTCGTEECSIATGLFCYASSNHCRHNIPPPVPDSPYTIDNYCGVRKTGGCSGLLKIVDDWIDSTKRSGIESTYGPIAEWDTSGVTSIVMLFCASSQGNGCNEAMKFFNADISKWNVSQVIFMTTSTSTSVPHLITNGLD